MLHSILAHHATYKGCHERSRRPIQLAVLEPVHKTAEHCRVVHHMDQVVVGNYMRYLAAGSEVVVGEADCNSIVGDTATVQSAVAACTAGLDMVQTQGGAGRVSLCMEVAK